MWQEKRRVVAKVQKTTLRQSYHLPLLATLLPSSKPNPNFDPHKYLSHELPIQHFPEVLIFRGVCVLQKSVHGRVVAKDFVEPGAVLPKSIWHITQDTI